MLHYLHTIYDMDMDAISVGKYFLITWNVHGNNAAYLKSISISSECTSLNRTIFKYDSDVNMRPYGPHAQTLINYLRPVTTGTWYRGFSGKTISTTYHKLNFVSEASNLVNTSSELFTDQI